MCEIEASRCSARSSYGDAPLACLAELPDVLDHAPTKSFEIGLDLGHDLLGYRSFHLVVKAQHRAGGC